MSSVLSLHNRNFLVGLSLIVIPAALYAMNKESIDEYVKEHQKALGCTAIALALTTIALCVLASSGVDLGPLSPALDMVAQLLESIANTASAVNDISDGVSVIGGLLG